ncbi:hypothetical protein GWK47_047475 [Chionoecetes opilio]|uniref:Uncharacterized protein n=1 Tax=Chionoecetes opilio TaxID=41210 RepID=A0A8J5CSQ0_CHIOP|nr:hypothetical protein GWK47_047475 [Chionoecetes opilio]
MGLRTRVSTVPSPPLLLMMATTIVCCIVTTATAASSTASEWGQQAGTTPAARRRHRRRITEVALKGPQVSTRKRKSDKISARFENPKCPSCIVHAIDIRDYGPLTSFRNVRGNPDEKLAYLHEIRENRMDEPLNSPRRMEAVCAQIPETLEGVDLEMIGYHRPCYQRFTANLHHLNDSTVASMSTKHHSPRKLSSAESSQLFPPECMFCEKFEIKVSGKTERPIKFLSWKHKEPAWKSIESQALELGKTCLYRQVKKKD